MSIPFSHSNELELVESGPQNGVFRLGSAHGIMTKDPRMRINGMDPEIVRIAIKEGYLAGLVKYSRENDLLDFIKSEFQYKLEDIENDYKRGYEEIQIYRIDGDAEKYQRKYFELQNKLRFDLMQFLLEAAPIYKWDPEKITRMRNPVEIYRFLKMYGLHFELS